MQEIHLQENDCLTDEEANQLSGILLDDSYYHTVIDYDCKVFKPDGNALAILKTNALGVVNCRKAYRNLRESARNTDNRGVATGTHEVGLKVKKRKARKDGTLSNYNVSVGGAVTSGIIGYFDRTPRNPYCRTTAYNLEKGHKFNEALPFIQEIDGVFSDLHPERYAKQKDIVERTHKDFVIHNTAFTTVTVNLNWQTAVHKDKGDYEEGFGVMTAICVGNFDGAYLCFPKYKIAVNVRTRSVLLADVHEWHCNSPFHGTVGMYERLSFVLYYRKNMINCGSAAEELERVKNRKLGDKLN